jgi:predicted DNA-binding transcriptional regulator YafY
MATPRLTVATRLQRLLALLQWVAAEPEGVTVSEACERFAMSERELLAELSMATMIGDGSAEFDDMPFLVIVEGDRVEANLLSFQRPLRITDAEGLALLASARALLTADTPPTDPLARALTRLADHLGVSVDDALEVDLDHDGGAVGRQLSEAVEARRQVRFVYWSYGRDAVEERTVEPWHLQTSAGEWYLSGYDVGRAGPRRFRLDRIEALETTTVEATRSPGPADEVGIPEDAPTVVLDLAPSAAWVAEAYPVLAVAHHDAGLRVTLAVTGPSWLERILVRLGPEARLVELDPRLGSTDLARQAARRILERYG